MAKNFDLLTLDFVRQDVPSEPFELTFSHTFKWLIIALLAVGLVTVVLDPLLTSLDPEWTPNAELTEQLPQSQICLLQLLKCAAHWALFGLKLLVLEDALPTEDVVAGLTLHWVIEYLVAHLALEELCHFFEAMVCDLFYFGSVVFLHL